MSIKNKKIYVLGGSGTIGLPVAKFLKDNGAKVINLDINNSNNDFIFAFSENVLPFSLGSISMLKFKGDSILIFEVSKKFCTSCNLLTLLEKNNISFNLR